MSKQLPNQSDPQKGQQKASSSGKNFSIPRGEDKTATFASVKSDAAPIGKHGAVNASTSNTDASSFGNMNEEVVIRKRKKRNVKRKKRVRIAVIVLVVLLVLIGGIAGAVWYNIQAGQAALQEVSQRVEENSNQVTYNGHTYEYNENVVSIVVMGYDYSTEADQIGQADAIMVLTVDTETGEANVIVVPRDSMVTVDEWAGSAYAGQDTMQLNLAFSYGDGGTTSAENVVNAVSRILHNMPMTYYFAIDINGIAPLNDAIGGVSLTALQTIPDTNIVEGETTLLYGNNALKYVQWRDTSVLDSAMARQERQIQYVQTYFSQLANVAGGDASVVFDLYNTISEYSVTNLGTSEISYLASTVLGSGISSLNITKLEGELVQGEKYAEVYLDDTSVYETVLDVYYTQID